MQLLHEELTYRIRRCIYEVRREIGAGFDEETYNYNNHFRGNLFRQYQVSPQKVKRFLRKNRSTKSSRSSGAEGETQLAS